MHASMCYQSAGGLKPECLTVLPHRATTSLKYSSRSFCFLFWLLVQVLLSCSCYCSLSPLVLLLRSFLALLVTPLTGLSLVTPTLSRVLRSSGAFDCPHRLFICESALTTCAALMALVGLGTSSIGESICYVGTLPFLLELLQVFTQ